MVGNGIKYLRKKKKLTQDVMAQKLGVSRQALCMWEANKRELKARTLNKIAKIFDVSVDEIIRLEKIAREKTARELGRKVKTKKVHFALNAPKARHVFLAGDFNAWRPDEIRMRRNRATGQWKKGLILKPGRYEYKFLVDNEWWTDPANTRVVETPFGNHNSIMEIKK